MTRAYYINGQCLVSYNGSELGLTDNAGKVTIIPHLNYFPIDVDGWTAAPPERQVFILGCDISMTLVHFDISILTNAMVNSTQGSAEGTGAIGGTLLGANNGYKPLTLTSPGPAANTWTFPTVFIKEHYTLPLGAERSLLEIVFQAVGYVADPWNSGVGSQGVQVYS